MNFLFTITDEFSDEIAGIYSTLMPKERKQRFMQCSDALHKKQIVAAYMLLCYSLNHMYGEDYVRIAFDYGATGKPYLQNGENKFFSISHSDKYVLCSVDNRAIGADIQKVYSGQESVTDFSIAESLIKLKGDCPQTQNPQSKISTQCKYGNDYVIAISSFGEADCEIVNVKFNELIAYFNQSTTIGEYITLNNYAPSFAVDYTPLEMFKRSVALYGDRIAVSFKGRSITYNELDIYSDVIAARLLDGGAKTGDAVLLAIGPGIEFSIAQFAIMKVGCTYVPISKRWPVERVNYIIKDCSITIAIFDKERLFFDCNAKVKVFCNNYLGETPPEINIDERENDVCYIIYTSGSTGSPKGVMVTKTNLASFSSNREGTYYHELVKSAYVRVACICPISFDMSVGENTTTLLNGSTVIFADEEEQYPENFARFIVSNKIEILWATPSKFKMYLQSENCREALKGLKAVVLAGEVLDFETARLSAEYPFQLYNTYGPTEATIISTYYHVNKTESNVPIGKPFANESCYVINSDGNLCEVGERGELCIAGRCVACGYKNNAAQTQEKFPKNIFGSGLMYRTGDMVALEKDGNLHFYGRKDNQVKVHGFRVELEEIESAIYEYTKDKTVVYFHEGRLVAFIESGLVKPDLSNQLKRLLPDYMVPALIYYVEKFPLNNNGKTDKKALMQLLSNAAPSKYVAPASQTERVIANCWSQYLNGVKVGMDDDFYLLGGDSISAMRIASELRKREIDVSMFDIMNSKTIRTLIGDIKRRQEEKINVVKTFINPAVCAPEDADMPLDAYYKYQANFVSSSMSYEYAPLKMHRGIMDSTPSCNRVIYKIEGTDNKNLIINAIKNLVKNNAAFRTTYDRGSGKCRQFDFSDGWSIPLLKTKDVNKRFLDANSLVSINGNIQYLSYIFLVEDGGGALYIALMLHWRFIDRSAEQIIKRQLIAFLNGNRFYSVGLTDPLEYTEFIRKKDFSKEVISDDIATALTEFENLSFGKECGCLLKNLDCVNYICHISLNKQVYDRFINNPLNFVVDLFADVLRKLFNQSVFPMYVVDQNRNMINRELIDTVIDFIPLVIGEEKYDYYRRIKKIISLKQEGESLIETINCNFDSECVPFVNYVSVLEEKDKTDVQIFNDVNVKIDVEEKHDGRLSCSAFIKDGKLCLAFSLPQAGKEALFGAIKQALNC